MTDKEIVKALESVAEWFAEHGRNTNTAVIEISRQAVALINRTKEKEKHYRQKVQNQRETINALQDKINRQQAEAERLTVNMNAFGLGMKREAERANTARAEAVKEFAERLKEKIRTMDRIIVYDEDIDNLVKEMVGEQNDNNP